METMALPSPADWPGERIAALRRERGFTQDQMADLLGYKQAQSVSDIERDQRKPSPSVCLLLGLIESGAHRPAEEG